MNGRIHGWATPQQAATPQTTEGKLRTTPRQLQPGRHHSQVSGLLRSLVLRATERSVRTPPSPCTFQVPGSRSWTEQPATPGGRSLRASSALLQPHSTTCIPLPIQCPLCLTPRSCPPFHHYASCWIRPRLSDIHIAFPHRSASFQTPSAYSSRSHSPCAPLGPPSGCQTTTPTGLLGFACSWSVASTVAL